MAGSQLKSQCRWCKWLPGPTLKLPVGKLAKWGLKRRLMFNCVVAFCCRQRSRQKHASISFNLQDLCRIFLWQVNSTPFYKKHTDWHTKCKQYTRIENQLYQCWETKQNLAVCCCIHVLGSHVVSIEDVMGGAVQEIMTCFQKNYGRLLTRNASNFVNE